MGVNETTLPEHYTQEFYREIYDNFPDGFLVVKLNGKVVGYEMNRLERGLSNFGFNFVKKGHVVSIAVIEEHRNKGLGTALLQESMNKMKENGCSEIYLEVRITNEPALKLYKKLGFSIIRTISYYYSDGESAYVMAKKLQ
ncbi:MAG: ribosomal protein S18-alanine N-acetyltransferase [Nitrososphaerota archaeon]|nr:ribosomal protein S18-alanine N-acetyltransferase [Nitrososphaerota archaeon]MDG6931438.1 ribosomal protein S18-alanine N-acetyltransferase [Nitrososphaerota archaeon]MDG6936560.1 ribosomal protein S18-alanine N-acetyltransferase [Nitrososphaerota archaeon]MDG6944213.1 ribosomal protein S18-alanine N-acetyltransferase [Nitrososphaerota archaeon]